ncbi:MAG: hypothetical protein WD250_11340 [Egibacteraceae bacterium]
MDEQTRQRVFARLREALGEEAAITLMAGIPPFDWSQVATKADVYAVRDLIGGLRGDMGGEISGLRSEIGDLRGEMGQMEARLSTSMATQTRYYMVATVRAVLTTGALAFAAAGLT